MKLLLFLREKIGRRVVFWLTGAALLFSGCAVLPGRNPFGETTYSEQKTEAVYEMLPEKFEELISEEFGYSIDIQDDTRGTLTFYRTQEYVVAYIEDKEGQKYLWYKGWLFRDNGDKVVRAEVPWESLGSDGQIDRVLELAYRLMGEEPEKMSYKHIPMAGENPYLLTAEYPLTSVEFDVREVCPKLMARTAGEDGLSSFTVGWSRPAVVTKEGYFSDSSLVSISLFPYRNSTNYQAERKIWFFGHEHGLSEESVPALGTQEEKRDWCRKVIEGMDFETLGKQVEELEFPEIFSTEDAIRLLRKPRKQI